MLQLVYGTPTPAVSPELAGSASGGARTRTRTRTLALALALLPRTPPSRTEGRTLQ